MDRDYISFKTKNLDCAYFIDTFDGKIKSSTNIYWLDEDNGEICKSYFFSPRIIELFKQKQWIKTNDKRGFDYA